MDCRARRRKSWEVVMAYGNLQTYKHRHDRLNLDNVSKNKSKRKGKVLDPSYPVLAFSE